jgi:predicted RNA binding protein YcfA (HicA-like mRNA interferase family)
MRMGKIEKLIKEMSRLPPEMRYEEVVKVLEAFGWKEVRSSGSHHVFRHLSGQTVTIPKTGGQFVKKTYLKKVLQLIDKE